MKSYNLHLQTIINPSVGSSLIDAGSGLLATAANVVSGILTNKANRESQEAINRQNIDNFWRYQEYMTPENQMERLRDAGLNPNLAVSGGSLSGSASASVPQMLSSRDVAPQVDPLTMAQIRNIDADTEQKKQNILESEQNIKESQSRIQVNNSSIEIAGQRYELDKTLTDAQVRQIDENLRLIQPQIDKFNAEVKNLGKQFELLDEQTKQEVVRTAIAEATKDAQIEQVLAELNLTKANAAILWQQYANNPALFQAQLNVYAAQERNLNANAFAQELENNHNSTERAVKLRVLEQTKEIQRLQGQTSKVGLFIQSLGTVVSAISPFVDAGVNVSNASTNRMRVSGR